MFHGHWLLGASIFIKNPKEDAMKPMMKKLLIESE